ncbi:transposable element Tcb1 transposase [Trichonephila clavipes]|nr:transposable element Tcb1 transposase [Trichonephila clavipes]
MKEGFGRQNGMKLSLLTSHASSVCNTTVVGFKSEDAGGERMLNSCVMHHHTGPASGIMVLGGNGISLLHSSSTHCRYFKQPALHLRGVGATVVLPYLQGLITAIFQQDNA